MNNPALTAGVFGGQDGGRRKTRRNGMSVKALKRALKKAGLKTTGKKAALTKRAKKAHLMRGGADATCKDVDGNDVAGAPLGGWTAESCKAPNTFTAASGGRRRRRNGRSRRGGNDD